MTRDYITYELQEVQSRIESLYVQEQAIEEAKQQKDRQKQRDVEKDAERARDVLLSATRSPSAVYQFLAATQRADETAFRTEWQKRNQRTECLQEAIKTYYQENFETPKIDDSVLSVLPAFSFVLQFTFTLAQPYISRDEQDFYIIDNPVRKDKVFGLPYVASTSWKGSLRAALWHLNHGSEDEAITHLFGNEKGIEDQELLRTGCLYFFPTFFTQKSLEIINPQDRKLRAGEKPITFESVPGGIKGTIGTFTLLYVPFDLIGGDERQTRKQVSEELKLVASGLQAMFCDYGFGAKTSSGFGLAKETISGSLVLRMSGNEEQKGEEKITTAQPVESSLARYLEAPDRLKPEYLTPEGTFRERSEAELKKMNKRDRQLYEKAKSWWERDGKQLAESAKLPKPVEPVSPKPLAQARSISWPKWSFDSFVQLLERVKEVANELSDGGRV
jgi:CRISPR-associated protein Cmr2